jgi:peptide/nickel transport system permease protein
MGSSSEALPSPAPEPLPTATPVPVAVPSGRRPNPKLTQLKRTLFFLRRNTLALVGLGILLFFVAIAFASFFYPGPIDHMPQLCGTYGNLNTTTTGNGGCICTYSLSAQPVPGCYGVPAFSPSLLGPTVHLTPFSLGPLPLGALTVTPGNPYFYDILGGLIKGAPWSLGIASSVVVSGSLIGLILGSVAGYTGGYLDESIMRFTDIFLAIPGLLLLIVILATAGALFPGLTGHLGILIIAFIATDWPIYTRIVRGQVLVTREQKYVEAAKASGANTPRILRKHIIPNSLYPVFVQMSLDIGTVPLGLATLVFLGFSIFPSPYFPEWGSITARSVNENFIKSILTYCQTDSACIFPWWQIFIPGLVLFFFAISVNFLSDGLRDALDPRLRR